MSEMSLHILYFQVITGPPSESVLFCSLASVVACNTAGGRANRRVRGRSGGRHCMAGQ